jgi:hypothetical protein
MTRYVRCRSLALVCAGTVLAACNQTADSPLSPSSVAAGPEAGNAQSADRCINVFVEGVAQLGIVVIDGVPTLAGLPGPTTFGDIPGTFGSVVTSLESRGAEGQGAQHLTLQHTFVSTDSARPGTFVTGDRAVCAPAGRDPNVCRVNDVMRIVSGTGIFANAGGMLRNHGVIDLHAFQLSYSVRGRICGDGL